MKWAIFNRFEFEMPDEAVSDCHHQGSCDEDVAYWADRIPRAIDPEVMRDELREYGAWDEDELYDDAQNWRRLLWIAAGNIQEEERGE